MSATLHALALATGVLACVWATGCSERAGSEPAWRELASLAQHGWLVDVAATRDGATWFAVGGTPAQGVVLRESASGSFTPEPIPASPLLHWVHVLDDGTAWVVGTAGTLLHYDGVAWKRHEAPTEQDLWGVWGAAPDDVWAVGGAGRGEGDATLLHYDGSVWSVIALPLLERPNVWALFKVWGADRNDVYVVGQRGAALHYDGTRWQELGLGTGEDLIAIFGVARDRIAVVGGRGSAVVATFDGLRWRTESLAPLPGLNGVFMADRETIHVAGIEGTLATVDFSTLGYQADYQQTDLTFHALHGAAGRLVAVGGNLEATAPPYQGLARETRSLLR